MSSATIVAVFGEMPLLGHTPNFRHDLSIFFETLPAEDGIASIARGLQPACVPSSLDLTCETLVAAATTSAPVVTGTRRRASATFDGAVAGAQ